MKIKKRTGDYQKLSLDKILNHIRKLCNDSKLGKLKDIDPDVIANKVVSGLYDGVESQYLNVLASEIAIAKSIEHPGYADLALRITLDNMYKNTEELFSEAMELLYEHSIINEQLINDVRQNKELINSTIDYSRDYKLTLFGYKTLEKSYLLKILTDSSKVKLVERPQHMWMRVSLGLHKGNIEKAIETYNAMSQGYFTHATPTLFNSGTNKEQFSSCFLLTMNEDSLQGIFKTISDCAVISKWSGGIGVNISDIRAKGAIIKGTNGNSDGIVPMLKVFNETARYANQGGGKRKGGFAFYIEPWHADVLSFLELKKNQGVETERARDIFLAMWMPDIFMKSIEEKGDWYLMCPDQCPGLTTTYGKEFEDLYNKYVSEGKYRKKVKAMDVWEKICESQIETGVPYLAYKDAVNKKNMQKNLGVIKGSNLCNEISLYTSKEEVAVCFTGDTRIVTKNGIRRIDECNGEEVLSYYNNDTDLKVNETYNKAKLICNGEKDVYKLNLYGNSSIKSTINHLYLTKKIKNYDKKEYTYTWKKMGELKEGDLVVRPNITPVPGHDKKHELDYAKVKGIEYIGKEKVYDLNVEETHNFIAEGLVVHNCNLSSIALPKYVEYDKETKKNIFNFEKLGEIVRIVVRNLNNVIDYNYYPIPEAEYSNKKNRPIGIGVQGLSDVYFKLKLPFDSETADQLNTKIFETIQYYAVSESIELAKEHGPYDSYEGSPWSEGVFQHNLWGISNETLLKPLKDYKVNNIHINYPAYDWDELKARLLGTGIRNSVLTCQMPTAGTSQLLNNTESTEAITSNIYMRKVLSGEFPVINKYLVQELMNKKLWTPDIVNQMIKNNGSIQAIPEIPDSIKEVYKIVWEIKQKHIINQSASRGPFIDQTQSLNLFIANPNLSIMSSMAFYAWKKGLKTGQYYLRSKPAAQPMQFTVSEPALIKNEEQTAEPEECEMCSA